MSPAAVADVDVVYPACDVDLFALRRWREHLAHACALGPSISVSTKASLTEADVEEIRLHSESLVQRGRVLKIGVSFSTRERVRVLEPNAPSYSKRMDTLRLLSQAGIHTALVLRPLLPDVRPEEYAAIVDDGHAFTDIVLTGPEHLDDDPEHARQQIRGAEPVTRVSIAWLETAPDWPSRRSFAQEVAVRRQAERHGMTVFDSDSEVMAAALNRTNS
jgi:hypothetical protein